MFPSFQTGPAHWPSWILQTVGLASLHNCMRQFLKINLFLFLSPLPHSCSSIYICTHTHTLLIYFLLALLLLWRTLTNAHPYHWSLEGRPFSSSGLSEMEAHGHGPLDVFGQAPTQSLQDTPKALKLLCQALHLLFQLLDLLGLPRTWQRRGGIRLRGWSLPPRDLLSPAPAKGQSPS